MSDKRRSDPDQVLREQQLTRTIAVDPKSGRLTRSVTQTRRVDDGEPGPVDERSFIADDAYRQTIAWALEQSIEDGQDDLQDLCEAAFSAQFVAVTGREGGGRPTLPAKVWAACQEPFRSRKGEITERTAFKLRSVTYHSSLYSSLALCMADAYSRKGAADADAELAWAEAEADEDCEASLLMQALHEESDEDQAGAGASARAEQSMVLTVTQAHLSAQIWRGLAFELNALLARKGVEGFAVRSRRATRVGSDATLRRFEQNIGVDRKDGIAFGAVLLELLIRATRGELLDLKSVLQPGTPPRTVLRAVLGPRLVERIDTLAERRQFVALNAPMIAKPLPWNLEDGTSQGACHARDLSFFKLAWKNDSITRFLRAVNAEGYRDEPAINAFDGRKRALEPMFNAVNLCQDTAWRINESVWALIRQLLDWRASLPGAGGLKRAKKQQDEVEVAAFPKHAAAKMARRAFGEGVQGGEGDGACPDDWRPWLTSRNFYLWRFRVGHWSAIGPGAIVGNAMTLATIEDAASRPRFWFGYQADTRGRIYPLAGNLNMQGADIAKALLEFADGRRIGGEAGARALAIHGSNLVSDLVQRRDLGLGPDHALTLDDRVRWVQHAENSLILPVADNPLASVDWRDVAKKPFLFYAFCLAWSGWKRQGADYVCHLPVHIDGSCNGLQHFSVLASDLDLARATNVVPMRGEDGSPVQRRDIYAEIAAAAALELSDVAPAKPSATTIERPWTAHSLRSLLAQRANQLFSREVAKKVVMVIPYGAAPNSYARHLRSALREKLVVRTRSSTPLPAECRVRDLLSPLWSQDAALLALLGSDVPQPRSQAIETLAALLNDLSRTMATAIERALHAKVPTLATATNRLKAAVELFVRKGLPACWVTPLGLPVLQPYYHRQVFEKDLACLGKLTVLAKDFGPLGETGSTPRRSRIRMQLDELTSRVDANDHRRGILPNFIHSMDASHLCLTVLKAHELGVRDFSVVHDSFGTHACDVAKLRQAVDVAFVDLYGRRQASLAYLEWWASLASGGLGEAAEQAACQAWAATKDPADAMRIAVLNFMRGQRGVQPIDTGATAMSEAFARVLPTAHAPKPDPQHPQPEAAPPGWLAEVRESPYFFA